MIKQISDSVANAGLAGEIRCWMGLGIGALAIAGVFALMLAVSRVPGAENTIPWPIGFFEKGLVIHVIMSFAVWFLAVFAAYITLLTAQISNGPTKGALLGKLALALAVMGFVLLAVPALLDRSEASLNNYIPVIIDPLYLAGLACFSGALVPVIVRYAFIVLSASREEEMLTTSGTVCSAILIAAFVCIFLAWIPNADQAMSERFFEDLFWGGGHVLQYLNTALMIVGWYILCAVSSGAAPVKNPTFKFVLLLCLYPALGAPILYFVYGVNSCARLAARIQCPRRLPQWHTASWTCQ